MELLYLVYATTREEELSQVPWSPEQKEEFLRMQFSAQHDYYQQQYPDAKFEIILSNDQPIGRLYVDRRPDEIRIIDIAMLTEHRGNGYGGSIMRDLMDEAEAAGKPVRIHVFKENRAWHLYDRLGFRETADAGPYSLMEWSSTGLEVDGSWRR